MRFAGWTLLLTFLLGASVMAQDGYPLPDDLQPITVENVSQLQELASVGGILQGQLGWSPDGETLVVGTSADLRLYDASDFETAPYAIPENGNFHFNTDGDLMLNDQRWNTQTGEYLGATMITNASFIDGTNDTPQVQVIGSDDGETILELRRPEGATTALSFSSEYTFSEIIFSPDERFAALNLMAYGEWGYAYPVIQLWNIADGVMIAELPQNLEILVTLTFHADGDLLVTAVTTDAVYGGPFEIVQIWDGRTGELVDTSYYMPVHFSPDRSLMAIVDSDGIALWTDHEIGVIEYDMYSETGQRPIIFGSDSRTITIGLDREISLWDVNTEQVSDVSRMTITTEENIVNLRYSPDELQLVSVEYGGIIEIWDAQSGERLTRMTASDHVSNVQFSADEQLLYGYEFGGNKVLWDVHTGEVVLTVPGRAVFNADISSVAYWDGGIVRVVDTSTMQETQLTVLPNYLGNMIAFNPLAERAIFTDDAFQIINLRNGEHVLRVPIEDGLPWANFSANGDYFILGSRSTVSGRGDPSIFTIRQTQDPAQPLARFEIPDGGTEWLLSPDGMVMSDLNAACGEGGGGSHSLWSIVEGVQLGIWYSGGSCGPYDHVFSADGNWLIVGWDYETYLFDMAQLLDEIATTDALPLMMPPAFGGILYNQPARQIIVSPDASRLAVATVTYNYESGQAEPIYNVDIYQFTDILTETDSAALRESRIQIPNSQRAIFSPESEWILTDSGFWNANSGEQLLNLSNETGAFHPDSTLLAIATDEGVLIWDLSALVAGDRLPLLTLDLEDVQGLAFSPDGQLLYIHQRGQIQVWGIPRGG